MYRGIEIIAEVKTQSPFGFKSEKTWDELFKIANKIGDIISIHTDPRWGGSFDLVRKARALTEKPILAKGIHANDELIEQAVAAGADWILVVGRTSNIYPEKCWIEPNSLEELRHTPQNFRAVWNSRDLETGGLKKETFEEARKIWPGWLVQASNIRTVSDIKPGADAILVGSCLLEFARSLS
ncbi:MAG: hypothetical protein AAB691_03875 [Patescibacteria group bacterium]